MSRGEAVTDYHKELATKLNEATIFLYNAASIAKEHGFIELVRIAEGHLSITYDNLYEVLGIELEAPYCKTSEGTIVPLHECVIRDKRTLNELRTLCKTRLLFRLNLGTRWQS